MRAGNHEDGEANRRAHGQDAETDSPVPARQSVPDYPCVFVGQCGPPGGIVHVASLLWVMVLIAARITPSIWRHVR